MARSFKKNPVVSNTKAESDKPFKVYEHKRERRAVRGILSTGFYDNIPDSKTFGNVLFSPKDGKHYIG